MIDSCASLGGRLSQFYSHLEADLAPRFQVTIYEKHYRLEKSNLILFYDIEHLKNQV